MAGSTVVRLPARVRLAMFAGYPTAESLLGAGLALILELWAQRTGFTGVLGAGGHVGEPVAIVVLAGIGAVVGLVVAASVQAESLRATVGTRALTLEWDDARVSVPRSLVRSLVLADDLVVLGSGGVELARVRCDVDRTGLRQALANHGYPDPMTQDPHAQTFESGLTDLGEPERRLLAARRRAVLAGAHGDAELLRRQLAARGVMVRDVHRPGRRSRGQQWRGVSDLLVAGAPRETAEEPAPAGPALPVRPSTTPGTVTAMQQRTRTEGDRTAARDPAVA